MCLVLCLRLTAYSCLSSEYMQLKNGQSRTKQTGRNQKSSDASVEQMLACIQCKNDNIQEII